MRTPDILFLLTVVSIVTLQLILGYRTSRLYVIAAAQAEINHLLVDLTKSHGRRISICEESWSNQDTIISDIDNMPMIPPPARIPINTTNGCSLVWLDETNEWFRALQ